MKYFLALVIIVWITIYLGQRYKLPGFDLSKPINRGFYLIYFLPLILVQILISTDGIYDNGFIVDCNTEYISLMIHFLVIIAWIPGAIAIIRRNRWLGISVKGCYMLVLVLLAETVFSIISSLTCDILMMVFIIDLVFNEKMLKS
ncbi:MAG: hypothetical protein LKF40_05620 [Megasphaera sp.]|jgi:hypothetical protein|nr:hypothetical protein [Megasphaera sp.]